MEDDSPSEAHASEDSFAHLPVDEKRLRRGEELLALIPWQGWVSWNELLEGAKKVGASPATVARHLKRFVAMGLVERHVDTESYPPKTRYRRTPDPVFQILKILSSRPFSGTEPPASKEEFKTWVKAYIHALMGKAYLLLALQVMPEELKVGDSFSLTLRKGSQTTEDLVQSYLKDFRWVLGEFAKIPGPLKQEGAQLLLLSGIRELEEAFMSLGIPLLKEGGSQVR